MRPKTRRSLDPEGSCTQAYKSAPKVLWVARWQCCPGLAIQQFDKRYELDNGHYRKLSGHYL